MLRTTLITIKKVCAFSIVPRIWREHAKYAPGKFEKLPVVITNAEKSSYTRDGDQDDTVPTVPEKKEDKEKVKRIIDYTFGKGRYPVEIIAEFERALEAETARGKLLRHQAQQEKAHDLQNNIALCRDEEKQSKGKSVAQDNVLYASTTRNQTNNSDTERLAQKIEKVDEVPLVEAEAPKLEDVDDLKTIPSLLGHSLKYQNVERTVGFSDDSNSLRAKRETETSNTFTHRPRTAHHRRLQDPPLHPTPENHVKVLFCNSKRKFLEFSSPEHGDITKDTLTNAEEVLDRKTDELSSKSKSEKLKSRTAKNFQDPIVAKIEPQLEATHIQAENNPLNQKERHDNNIRTDKPISPAHEGVDVFQRTVLSTSDKYNWLFGKKSGADKKSTKHTNKPEQIANDQSEGKMPPRTSSHWSYQQANEDQQTVVPNTPSYSTPQQQQYHNWGPQPMMGTTNPNYQWSVTNEHRQHLPTSNTTQQLDNMEPQPMMETDNTNYQWSAMKEQWKYVPQSTTTPEQQFEDPDSNKTEMPSRTPYSYSHYTPANDNTMHQPHEFMQQNMVPPLRNAQRDGFYYYPYMNNARTTHGQHDWVQNIMVPQSGSQANLDQVHYQFINQQYYPEYVDPRTRYFYFEPAAETFSQNVVWGHHNIVPYLGENENYEQCYQQQYNPEQCADPSKGPYFSYPHVIIPTNYAPQQFSWMPYSGIVPQLSPNEKSDELSTFVGQHLDGNFNFPTALLNPESESMKTETAEVQHKNDSGKNADYEAQVDAPQTDEKDRREIKSSRVLQGDQRDPLKSTGYLDIDAKVTTEGSTRKGRKCGDPMTCDTCRPKCPKPPCPFLPKLKCPPSMPRCPYPPVYRPPLPPFQKDCCAGINECLSGPSGVVIKKTDAEAQGHTAAPLNESSKSSMLRKYIKGTRTFEPWTPIPSWPLPPKAKKVDPCQKECPVDRRNVCERGKPAPCTGFPKRLTFSLQDFNAKTHSI